MREHVAVGLCVTCAVVLATLLACCIDANMRDEREACAWAVSDSWNATCRIEYDADGRKGAAEAHAAFNAER